MLKIDFCLNGRALWHRRVGAGVSAGEYAAPVEVKCRVNLKCGIGECVGKIYLDAACPAAPGDRFTINGGEYILKSIVDRMDLSGQVHHREGELA